MSNKNSQNPFEKFVKHLKLESLSLAILMVVLTYYSPAPLWILPATFLFFDIGMIGYLKNTKFGALTYNISHDFTIPTILIALGLMFNVSWVSVVGYCWVFHVAIDRSLGYGLKHEHSFNETHLGKIGKN
jgi:hypothetical protein